METIIRNYLEIKSLNQLSEIKKSGDNYSLNQVIPNDFQLNKFFYKQIGKNYQWVDRLIWTDKNWIEYVSSPNLFTFVLKNNDDIAGFFELMYHKDKLETEIAYFGLLKEYFGKKLGGYMLSEAIKKSFSYNVKRVWAHTCSLDHKNALKNYLSRGMKIYNTETVNIKSA
jgi:ribosomal protein S18 acetylase RimI-like enzyme